MAASNEIRSEDEAPQPEQALPTSVEVCLADTSELSGTSPTSLALAGQNAASGTGHELVDPVGLALSGGGIRAALFSLGVMVGLVECGLNDRVTQIASVSGGSITNAAVALSCEYRSVDSVDAFQSTSQPLAQALCRRGTFVYSGASVAAAARAVAPQLAGFIGIAASLLGTFLNNGNLSTLPWISLGVAFLLVTVIVLVLGRGRLQEAMYAATLKGVSGDRPSRMLTDFVDSSTTHVLVATDLVSGDPIYFARNFVACPAFGWGTSQSTTTAAAVYSSAAFPVVFPPRRTHLRRFLFQNGTAQPPFPRTLKLADGGVYNNHGNDWMDVLAAQEGTCWPFGNIDLPRPLKPVATQIIVNAGAASGGLRPVLPLLSIRRTMTVLYDNTVRPRLAALTALASRSLDAPIVIDITESPTALATRLTKLRLSGMPPAVQEQLDGVVARATTMLARLLSIHSEKYWDDFARQTASTKTKLTRAGVESGARMLMHGYLSTVVACHILHDAPLPDPIRDEGYFLDLAGRLDRSELATRAKQPSPPGDDIDSGGTSVEQ